MNSEFEMIMRRDACSAFLNPNEFGEKCIVNGREMTCLIDNNELQERQIAGSEYQDGLYGRRKLLYVSEEDYGPEPKVGSKITFCKAGGREMTYLVINCINESGIYSIEMEANRL